MQGVMGCFSGYFWVDLPDFVPGVTFLSVVGCEKRKTKEGSCLMDANMSSLILDEVGSHLYSAILTPLVYMMQYP